MATAAKPSTSNLLHLGCGLVAPPEWLNIDGSVSAWLAKRPRLKKLASVLRILPRKHADVVWPTNIMIADLRKPLPFPDESFDAVYSSHLIEHLFRDRALALLGEARRVLRPGGRCRTLVPDLRKMVDDYVAGRAIDARGQQVTARVNGNGSGAPDVPDPARAMVSRLMMRGEASPRGHALYRAYQAGVDFFYHKWMYDGPSLVHLMTEAGFTDCRERGFLDTEIPHLEKVEMRSRYDDGVAVEGRK